MPMKWIVTLLFILTLGFFGSAQSIPRVLDSLSVILKNHVKEDTVQLHLLNEIAFAYHAISPVKGLQAAEQAILLAKKLNNQSGLATAYSRKGTNHWALGQDSLAMKAFDLSLTYHKASGNMLDYAKVLNNKGLEHYKMGNYVAAIRDHEEAAEWFEKLDFPLGVKHQWSNIGVVLLTLNDYPRALNAFLKADHISAEAPLLQANILSNIGLVYKNIGEYTKAFQYQQQALKIHREMGSRKYIANTISNIATLYDLTGEPEKAIGFYLQAIKIKKELGNDREIANELTNLAIVYNKMDNKVDAAKYLEEAIILYSNAKDHNGLSTAQQELAETYEVTSAKRISLQKMALAQAKESGSPLRQSNVLRALSESYEKLGDFRSALQSYKQYILLQDAIFNQEKKAEIVRQQMLFDFEKKEALLQAKHEKDRTVQQAEIRRQAMLKKTYLIGGTGFLLAVIMGFILYKRKQDALVQKNEAEFKALVSDTELKALRSQMNPHFIFNSLNSIGDYILKNDISTAESYLTQFAKLIRMTLENSEFKEIPLSEDLEFIELYLQVESKRFPGKFTYTISIDKQLDTENILVPPLILQPFIENSIWHGFKSKETHGHILVEIKQENEMLLCRVEDNGSGRDLDDIKYPHKKSLGITITENRIKILNKQKRTNGKLRIIDKQNKTGTCIEVKLPLQTAF